MAPLFLCHAPDKIRHSPKVALVPPFLARLFDVGPVLFAGQQPHALNDRPPRSRPPARANQEDRLHQSHHRLLVWPIPRRYPTARNDRLTSA